MMAATTASMVSSAAALGGLTSRQIRGVGKSAVLECKVGSASPCNLLVTRRRLQMVRAGGEPPLGGVREAIDGVRDAVDKATKKDITREDILRNQEENESEKRSVFGAKPTSGSPYPRSEIERRPETGDTGFASIFAFDGAAPETINGRLAMLGFVWAVVAERISGLTVFDQLYSPAANNTGLVFFIGVVQLFTFASIIPIMNGESTDARSSGPFTAKAERWNGRLAMIGFLGLVLTEQFTHLPVFGM